MFFARFRKKLSLYITLARLLRRDANVPWLSKILPIVGIVYLFSPIDIIPDFIPLLGQLDDLLIVPTLIVFALSLIPKDIFKKHRDTVFGDDVLDIEPTNIRHPPSP